MKNKLYSINLIRDKKKKFLDKFIDWALTIGRVIIIITEGIALATFLYRFSLDRELIDLHDKINQKQAIVKNFKANEEKFRNLQGRLTVASKFIDTSFSSVEILTQIINFAPDDLLFKNLTISEGGVKLDATTKSIQSLSKFIKSIKEYSKTEYISLDRIENKTSNTIIAFSLTINFKKINNIIINK